MYMIRNEAEVSIGRSVEFEDKVDELSAINLQQPGFLGATFLQSFGNPGRYTLISRWADRDSARTAVRTEQVASFIRSLSTSNLFRPVRLTEAYESVFEVDADNVSASSSTCELLIDWTLKSPALAPAFEAFARQVSDIGKRYAPGFVSGRLRRYLGNDIRYLALNIVTDRAAARARFQVPEFRAFMDAHPYTEFATAPPTIEVYDVVKRYAATTPSATQAAVAAAAR